ncbi:MAG: MBL fold metallo-hydrolase [Erysipelotrichaceae bacterium]|nr:MBL fold metallo-hydrolase [Erysipelotrichaceae bacterium]
MDFIDTVLTDHLIRIEVPGNVFVYLAQGENRAVLIDTGLGTHGLKEHIQSLTALPYTVVLTHGHVDHAGGAGEFPEVYLNAKDIPIAKDHTRKTVRLGYFGPESGFSEENLVDSPEDDVWKVLEDGTQFDLGGETLEIIPLPGHTPGSVAVLLQNDRIMITGDAMNSAAYLQLDHSLPLKQYRDSLIAFKERTDGTYDTLLYSHPHNKGGREILPQMISLCEEILTGRTVGKRRPDVIGPNTYEAYPSGEDQMRLDGMLANLMYNPDNLG